MTKVTFIEKDQIWQEEQTNYWFEVDGEQYAIADKAGEAPKLLDFKGYPIEDCNDRDRIKELLLPEYEKRIND